MGRWLKWVGIGCGGLLVLCIVFGIGVYFIVRTASAGPEQVVQEFLSAAGAGDADRAYVCFSAPLKEVQPLEKFRATVTAHPTLFSVTDTSFTERTVNLTTAKLAGTATLKSGTHMRMSFGLTKENGAWKLTAYHIGS